MRISLRSALALTVAALTIVGISGALQDAAIADRPSKGNRGRKAETATFSAACVDLTCDFTNTSSGIEGTGVVWTWDFGDGSSSHEEHPSHTFPIGGFYDVSLTLTTETGATSTDTNQVGVPPPGPGVRGDWVGSYGADGYVLAAWEGASDQASFPAGTILLKQGTRHRWTAHTDDWRALQDPSATSRRAAAYHHKNRIKLILNFERAYAGELHLYAVDWDSTARRQVVSVEDATGSNHVGIDQRFDQGVWLHFPIDVPVGGSVVVTVNRTAGSSAVLSGIHLGAGGTPEEVPPPTSTTTTVPPTTTSTSTTTTVPPTTSTTSTTSTTTTVPPTTTSTTSTTTTVPPTTSTTTTVPPPTTTTTTTVPPPGSGLGEGSVGLLVHARSAFDPWTESPSVAEQQTMRALYDRMVVYSPYFDGRLAWYPNGLAYIDAYAIYTNTDRDDRSITNPEWILRDAAGNRLYIPYACSGGTCPQWAGDFGNPAFRNDFLNRIQALINRGYRGIMLDDVNLEWRTSDGFGNRVIPIDPRTGAPMTLQDWRRYFAEFMELIRTTHPDIEIMHNALWFADSPDFDDPSVTRQIAAADWIMLERGANDNGLVGGADRRYGFDSFLGYIERADTLGTDVLLLDEGDYPGSATAQEYNLAAYFLINSGGDLVSTEDYPMIAHDSLWPGFTTDLGDALGPRTRTHSGLHQRDFTNGIVLLNEPGAAPTTINLTTTYTDLTGNPITTLTLQPETAAILLNP